MNRHLLDGQSLITPESIAAEFAASATLDAAAFAHGKAQLALVLNTARQQFERGTEPSRVIHQLAGQLHKVRGNLPPEVWRALLPIAQNHPVSEFLLQDPFTRWSFEKPRGYSGDAHLLDFIYGHPSTEVEVAGATAIGKALYDYTKEASSSVAVRERRDLVARQVDRIADERGPNAEILTIAAGHLREANASVALREGRLKRWVALDQDPLSVGSVARDFAGTSIQAIDGSVRGLLTRAYKLGKFDFVYSAGLYDYLSHNVAVKLTQRCLSLLKPNGILLFANFASDIGVDGYMETFMNWPLLLRSEQDMWAIINDSVDRNQYDARVTFGANRNIVYATLEKRAQETSEPTASRTSDRFAIIREPTDMWLVWDLATDLPAEYLGLELFGLSRDEASRYCEELNKGGSSQYRIDSYS